MGIKVLVIYASKNGATAEIAEKIEQVLQAAGLRTDLLSVDNIIDLTRYNAVILGSAVYIGHWRKKAAAFLKVNEKILSKQPLWLFSSGPTGQGDPVELSEGWSFPKALQPIADRIRPRDIVLFHGNVNIKNLGFIGKWMMKKVEAPIGDFRDWETITSWASTIAVELEEEEQK